ncbi:peptidyl-prolyl cis-trans isomerase FKBP8 isoform X2 [Agrilus planipennis]|nr:peptidyl-prolyl cis-trans isomerase FKBP8 isoform X2 [Agrilus planipennis]
MSDYEIESGDTSDDSSVSLLNDLQDSQEINNASKQNQGDTNTNATEKVNDTNQELNNGKTEKWEDVLGSGSILKLTLVEGKLGTRPISLQNCKIKYKCYLEDGVLVEEQDDFEVQIGDNEVVQGLDVVLALMNVGETSKIKIEPRLAYGSRGLESKIPPNATILYEVTLLSADDDDEPESLNLAQRKLKGNKKRERGNWWYGRGENQIAIQCYRRALDYLDEVEGGIKQPLPDGEKQVTDAELQKLLEDRINVCNNMAAAQIKLELFDAALQSLQTVLRCQPENVKALYRKAKVLRAKNDLNGAMQILQKANKIEPKNVDIQKEILSIQGLLQKQKNSEKELARRMFKDHIGEKKTEKPTSFKLYVWATLGASVAVGLAGMAAAYRLNFFK